MPGFLDPDAVSIQAEYTRYLDPDILGKIVFKNFALNVLKLEPARVRIPLSRQGDLGPYKDSCDAGIRFGSRWYNVETKCSRWVVAKKSRADPSPRWQFNALHHSARGRVRSEYDLVFAVGIHAPGLEDSLGYWKHLHSLKKAHEADGRTFDFQVWPHDPVFLSRCGIYVLPRESIAVNKLDITIRALARRPDFQFFGWGHETSRLRDVWSHAIQIVNASPSVDELSLQS